VKQGLRELIAVDKPPRGRFGVGVFGWLGVGVVDGCVCSGFFIVIDDDASAVRPLGTVLCTPGNGAEWDEIPGGDDWAWEARGDHPK
jgi:hypothetical protein